MDCLKATAPYYYSVQSTSTNTVTGDPIQDLVKAAMVKWFGYLQSQGHALHLSINHTKLSRHAFRKSDQLGNLFVGISWCLADQDDPPFFLSLCNHNLSFNDKSFPLGMIRPTSLCGPTRLKKKIFSCVKGFKTVYRKQVRSFRSFFRSAQLNE